LAENPRLQKRDRGAFIEMMQNLNLTMPAHRYRSAAHQSGGKTVAQMLSEAAARCRSCHSRELKACLESRKDELIVLDVRERDAFEEGHIPGAQAPAARATGVARQPGADRPDPEDYLSTASSAESRRWRRRRCVRWEFRCAVALDGGMKAWREASYAVKAGQRA